jgi:streptomycin 6-kinase
MVMQPLPSSFMRTIRGFSGGAAWLDGLPDLLAECAQRWQLEIAPPFELSFNYVAPCRLPDGSEAVLKVGLPNPELATEIEALHAWAGEGAVRLMFGDPQRGILLMERIIPGTPVYKLEDDAKATEIAADVLRALSRHAPPDGTFPDLYRWTRSLRTVRDRFAGGTGPLPEPLLTLAQRLAQDLIASSPEPRLLHGDLHHWNILRRQDAGRDIWLAIDPKGVVGDPAFDIGPWMYNPLPDLLRADNPRKILARRVDQFVDLLALDRQRVVAWGVAECVLSACWIIEDAGEADWWQGTLTVAGLLAEMLR